MYVSIHVHAFDCALLLDHVYRALEERVERSTLKQAILQQGSEI